MERDFDFKNFGRKPLPIIPIEKKLKQSFYKEPIRMSQRRAFFNIGVHVYDFQRHQQDFINYALQYFLSQSRTPIKLYINRPNHVYMDLSMMVENVEQQTTEEQQFQVLMVSYLIRLREIFVGFFKNNLDWDRIVKENLNDQKLLEEFKKEVIDRAQTLYKDTINAKKNR